MSFVIWNKFVNNAASHPDKAAFIYSQKGIWKTVTYAQLLDSTNRFTCGLQACHVIPGMRAAPIKRYCFNTLLHSIKLRMIKIYISCTGAGLSIGGSILMF